MGYTTQFEGHVAIEPALNSKEIIFLKKFNETRRMDRENGPYFVNGSGDMGQGRDKDIRNHNEPPLGQPSLWCQWVSTEDGEFLEWDGNEKFYNAPEWMKYLIEHFLKPGCIGAEELPFLQANHVLNGEIEAQGEEPDDSWVLVIKENSVMVPGESVDWDVVKGKQEWR